MDFKVTCPACGARIDVSKQIEYFIENQSEKKASQVVKDQQARIAKQAAEQARVEERAKIKKENAESDKLTKSLQRQVNSLTKSLEAQQEEFSEQVEVKAQEVAQRQVSSVRRSYAEKLSKEQLRNKELEKNVRAAQTKVKELETKLSEGSPQFRGIIAEGGLYEYLKSNMPQELCVVERRGQGRKGTDIIIHVHRNGDSCGSIIIDDKGGASEWGMGWAEKVWNDMCSHKGDFAYLAVNLSAFPKGARDKDLREAGFGPAPCKRTGVKVWVIDRTNLPLLCAILLDCIEKISKVAEIKSLYGGGSTALRQFQKYLAEGYGTDLREKAKYMSTAVKSLNDLRKKVNDEYERTWEALLNYWNTEARQHKNTMRCFGEDVSLPRVTFIKQG